MKIEIEQGESVSITMKGSDGEFIVTYGPTALTVFTEWPDTTGREGVIYSEEFGDLDKSEETVYVGRAVDRDEPLISLLSNANYDRLVKIVVYQLGVKVEDVLPSSTLSSLGANSLDVVELVIAIEEEFDIEIPDEDAENNSDSVASIAKYLAKRLEHKDL